MFVKRCPETGQQVERVYKMSGQLIDDKYEIGDMIGMGGMGVVYTAVNVRIGRTLAIKFLSPHVMSSPQAITRFENEARIAASVGHRNIVDIIDLGETSDGDHYIVMEMLPGRDLGDILDLSGRLPVFRAVDFTIQILSALRTVHEQGIIHRDLKPENLRIVGEHGKGLEIKIVDFGISRLAGAAGRDLGLTRTGAVLGTPKYMAPEQARGKKEIDRRADLYSVGVILYRMLTGALPFVAEGHNDMIIAINTEDPIDVRSHGVDLPEGLADVVMTAIRRDPDHRFENATMFFQAIRPFRNWDEGAEEPDIVDEPQPMLDWSVVTDALDPPSSPPSPRTSSTYSMSGTSGMVDVVPNRIRLATVRPRTPTPDRVSAPAPVIWNEPGAPRRTNTYSMVGSRNNPSLVERVSPIAARHDAVTQTGDSIQRARLSTPRKTGAIGRSSGKVATPMARISPLHVQRQSPHATASHRRRQGSDSLAGVSIDSGPAASVHRDDSSASIEGWTGPTSQTPTIKKSRNTRRWLMVASATFILLGAGIAATVILSVKIIDRNNAEISLADAGPSVTVSESLTATQTDRGVAGTGPVYHELDLGTLPKGTMIYVDGALHPERPLKLEQGEAPRSIEIVAEGYDVFETTLVVSGDDVLKIDLIPIGAGPGTEAVTLAEKTPVPETTAEIETKAGKKAKKKKAGDKSGSRIDETYPGLK